LLRDLWTPLALGAHLSIPSSRVLGEPAELFAWMQQEELTTLHLTPSRASFLASGAAADASLPTIRWVLFGGEPLSYRQAAELRHLAPKARRFNVYGTTETPQVMACHEIDGDAAARGGAERTGAERDDGGRVPLGRGRDGVDLLILGPGDNVRGVGELGEICIRSPYLARGYLGDPELTRERFTDPFAAGRDDDVRFYRTGDLGRYRPDGSVEIAGRTDLQVKVRGVRVEPEEIEAQLTRLDAIRAAAVVAARDRLVAFCETDPPLDGETVRQALARRLPEALVPDTFRRLDALPLTPNGKIDRAALERLALESAPPADAVEPSFATAHGERQPTEELLAAIWSDVLGTQRIAPDDSFFSLGGHSLVASRVVAQVRDRFGVELPLRQIFETPRLNELATKIESLRDDRGALATPPLESLPRGADGLPQVAVPLSFAQERLWFLDQLDPGSGAYNMPAAVELVGTVDVAALRTGLATVVRRHESLRTTFHVEGEGGHPVQVIAPPSPPALPIVDLAVLAPTDRRREARQLATAEAQAPFDLQRGPLLRARLLRLAKTDSAATDSDARHALLLTQHHTVSDGWSTGILVHEIATAYAAAVAGRAPALPPLPVQYADYAAWQRGWLDQATVEGQLAFWRESLAGAPPLLELPTDRPRTQRVGDRGGERHRRLDERLTSRLEGLVQQEGATLFMVLLAAFQSLLHRASGQDDVVVGVPIAGRPRRELEGLIGFLTNTLVFRGRPTADPFFDRFLAATRETALDVFAHQQLPFEKLVEALSPERHLGTSPLFQVIF
ncbi:MAG: condensation domain-containing protein, partial [Acidobacteriota bacterium]